MSAGREALLPEQVLHLPLQTGCCGTGGALGTPEQTQSGACVAAYVGTAVKDLSLLFSVVDFPTPKTELVQKFHVQYLGMLPVDKPVGTCNTYVLSLCECPGAPGRSPPPRGWGLLFYPLSWCQIRPLHCHQPQHVNSPDQKSSRGQAKLLCPVVPRIKGLQQGRHVVLIHAAVRRRVVQGCGGPCCSQREPLSLGPGYLLLSF